MPPMGAELGWSRGETSGALSLAILLSGVCAAPVGRWLDARGPRLLMSVGSVAATVLMVAWSRVSSLTELYVVWALIGVTMSAVLYEPAFAVVTAWFERDRTRALTAVTLMAGFASTIFMPIESWLVEAQGWRSALVTLAIFLGISTIVPHALLLRRRPEDLGLHLDGDAHGPDHRAAGGCARSVPVGVALREPAFRWLAVAFGISSMVSIAVHVHLVAYLQDVGYDLMFAATATGLVGAMQVVGRIILGLVGDRAPRRVAAAIVLGILPVSLVIALAVPGPVGVFAFICLFGAARGALTLVRPAFVADLYGRDRYATIAGALAAFVTAGTALAPISAGMAYDALGTYAPLFWAYAALSAVAAGVVLLAKRSDAEPVMPSTPA